MVHRDDETILGYREGGEQVIEFFDTKGVLGTVQLGDDNTLQASGPETSSYVNRWVRQSRPVVDFESFYDGWSNGYVSARRVPDDVTAAAEVHTGAMVALVPIEADAERLAVDGGEDADQLHVTLGYLGEAALIPEEVQHALIESVARCALDRPTIVGNAFALAAINPETGMTASTGWELDEVDDLVAGAGGKEPCVALLLSGSQLPGFHEYVMRSVQQTFVAAGVEMHQQHSPWVAHLTLVYTPDADLSYFTDRIGPVTFDRVRVAFGGDVYDIPLGESAELTAGGDHWREQKRAPRGTEEGGQWIDVTPDAGDSQGSGDTISIASAADRGNFTFRPDDDTVEAVRKMIGENVEVTVDFGTEFVAKGKLLDTGESGNGTSGIKIDYNGSEMFMMWNSVKSISPDEKLVEDRDESDESDESSPQSQIFHDITKNAVSGTDALFSAPGISEQAPDEQHWALGAYETEGYRAINGALRTGNMKGSVDQNRGEDGIVKTSIRENVRGLDALMRDSVVSRDIMVHRGVRSLESLGLDPDINLEGLEWADPAYSSTSTDRGRAAQFARNYGQDSALLNIFVPKGTHGINLGYDEQEVLLDRGYRFRVVADRGIVDGIRQLDVEVTPK